ncbi:hypothetical protein JHK87_042381 [Glycine soja]|nr:hypothetical protein JHK87_042381 [Glycine soja]
MPQPKELPGFYYDPEKNRYFPIKGPIPGSSSKPKTPALNSPQTSSNQESGGSCCRKLRNRTLSKLLQARELDGHSVVISRYCRSNFTEEFRKMQASRPVVWKYRGTDGMRITALEHLRVDVQTSEGQTETDVLLTGSTNGSMSFSQVGGVGRNYDGGTKWRADCVKNYVKGRTDEHNEVLKPVFKPNRAALLMSSRISSIRLGPKCSSHAVNDGHIVGRALFTTLGSETSGGSVYTLDLVEPLNLGPALPYIDSDPVEFRLLPIAIGTNLGGASVDLETGTISWFLHCKSDVFAQQIVSSGNVILCGLRNGAIVTVDSRESRESLSGRLITHRIPYTSSDKKVGGSNKEWFKLKGDIYPSHTIRMPSSISCLASLQFDDQYFLASSMDGSMRLYDLRLLQRGAVQCYEGHVNSHTRIQIGVDPSERFVMSGGEDCKLRLWSIKSGELLFEDKFSDSVISTVLKQKRKTNTSVTRLRVHGLDHLKDCFICAGYECEGSCSYRI